MERLALLGNAQPLPVPMQGGAHPPRRTASPLDTLFWFGLGTLASGAIGGITVLGLQALAAGDARMKIERGVVPADLAKTAPVTPNRHTPPEIVEVAIDRSARARASLGLQVTGTDDDNVDLVLQGVPASATLSRGKRRDAATWVLRRAELDGLYLTLNDTAPDTFDIRIDVLAPPGVTTVGSVARVHIVDATPPERITTAAVEAQLPDHQRKSVAAGTGAAKLLPAEVPAANSSLIAASDEKIRRPPAQRRPVPVPVEPSVAQLQPAAPVRPWPEGASALGAVPRDSERQVWWNMPPPSWSPFQDPAATP